MVLYLKLWYSFYIRVEHGGYMKIIWREERNLCAQHHPPPRIERRGSRAGRAFEHLLDTVAQDYENNNGGGKGWEGRGGGELQGRGWAAIRKTPPAS
jgi:hypothetical protein